MSAELPASVASRDHTLGVLTHGRDNNFLVLRLLAATLVVWHHSWALTRVEGEPLRALGFKPGLLGVAAFFTISGFLVTLSVQRRAPWDFLRARVARIFPGLWVSVLVCAFVVGPLVTTLDLKSYFLHPRLLQFLIADGAMLNPRFDLPAVFEQSPYPYAVNGSLWTLPYELLCYAGLLIFAGWLRSRRHALGLTILLLGLILWLRLDEARWTQALEATPFRPHHLHQFLLYFLLGCVAALHAHRIPATPRLALVALALTLGCGLHPVLREWAFPFVYGYLVLCAAVCPLPAGWRLRQLGDYSYGLYIYSMPVQQLFIHWHPGVGPLEVMAASLPLAMLPAIASWHLVERPALERMRPRSTPLPDSAPLIRAEPAWASPP